MLPGEELQGWGSWRSWRDEEWGMGRRQKEGWGRGGEKGKGREEGQGRQRIRQEMDLPVHMTIE